MQNTRKLKSWQINCCILVFFFLFVGFMFRNELNAIFVSSGELTSNIQDIYLLKYDYVWQHIPFHKEFFRLLDNGDLFSWSWNLFLGTNFYASKAYYLVGDIFTYITYGLDKIVSFTEISMFLVLLLKIILSGFGFTLLLRKVNVRTWIALLFGCMYSFSGWQTIFLEQPVFTSFYAMLPFLFLGTEYILQNKKYGLFVLFSTLILCINYYLCWPACILLLMYWIVRYNCIIDKFDRKEFLNFSFKTLFYFVIALGISSIVWLPSLLHIINSTRVTNELNSYTGWSLISISAIIMNFIVPIIKNPKPMFGHEWYYFNQIGLYAGVLCIVLLPSLFNSFKNKKISKMYVLWIVILLLTLVNPIIGKLFHFTYSLRYAFIIMFTLLFSCAQILNNTKKFKVFHVVLGVSIVIGIYLIARYYLYPQIYKDEYFIELSLMKWACIIAIIYGCMLLCIERIKFKYISIFIIIGMFGAYIVELSKLSGNAIDSYKYPNNELENIMAYQETYGELDEVLSDLQDYDSSFYRIALHPGLKNDALYSTKVRGLKTYDSVYQYTLRDFLEYFRQYPDTNWEFYLDTKEYFPMLGVKYVVFQNNAYYDYEWMLDNENKLPISSDNYAVYPLKEKFYIAKTFNNIITRKDMLGISENWDNYYSVIADVMTNNLVIKNKDLNKVKGYINQENFEEEYFIPTSYDENYMTFNINLSTKKLVYFSIPIDDGWICLDNGEKIDIIDGNGGFITLMLDAGSHSLKFEFHVKGLNFAVVWSIASVFVFCIIQVTKKVKLAKQE